MVERIARLLKSPGPCGYDGLHVRSVFCLKERRGASTTQVDHS